MHALPTVFLTGFMATGKSRVGRVLAEQLDVPFFDSDREVEREVGLSVAEIFESLGEPVFRSEERRVLDRLSRAASAIVATGGGAVLDPGNRTLMRERGRIVCLAATPEVIAERVRDGDTRPLLAGATDKAARIRELLKERAPAYADADLTVETNGRSAEDVAGTIAEWLRR